MKFEIGDLVEHRASGNVGVVVKRDTAHEMYKLDSGYPMSNGNEWWVDEVCLKKHEPKPLGYDNLARSASETVPCAG